MALFTAYREEFDIDRRNCRRSGGERVDRRGFVTLVGELRVSSIYDWGLPARRSPRLERFDHGRKVWTQVSNGEMAAFLRLSARQRKTLLEVHRHGLRVVADFDDARAVELEAKLDAAIAEGWLKIGHRSYRLTRSGSGNLRVISTKGAIAYSRDALLDVLQRGSF